MQGGNVDVETSPGLCTTVWNNRDQVQLPPTILLVCCADLLLTVLAVLTLSGSDRGCNAHVSSCDECLGLQLRLGNCGAKRRGVLRQALGLRPSNYTSKPPVACDFEVVSERLRVAADQAEAP